MKRAVFVHSLVTVALVTVWLFAPRGMTTLMMALVALTSAALMGWLVTNTRTQFFVPTTFQGSPDVQSVAFTFDDGPHPVYTPLILDVLRDRGAKATFFVVGRAAEQHPHLIRRMVADGHLVASHTYSHSNGFHFWRARRMAVDIELGIEAVRALTKEAPRFFRPPQGIRVPTLRDALALVPHAPECITWTVRGLDTFVSSAAAIVARVRPELVPGAIVTLHDGADFGGRKSRQPTVMALKQLLDDSAARRLRPVRLDELLGQDTSERFKLEALEK